MSSANDSPQPRLDAPEEASDPRTQTWTRLKEQAPAPDASGPSASPSAIPPEALRKPYASLAPQKPSADSTKSLPPSSRRMERESKRWNDTTEARRSAGVCNKHGIARAPSGECMLCKKEQARSQRSPWPMILLGIAAVCGLGVAAVYLL
jgi:hypothetical protein